MSSVQLIFLFDQFDKLNMFYQFHLSNLYDQQNVFTLQIALNKREKQLSLNKYNGYEFGSAQTCLLYVEVQLDRKANLTLVHKCFQS